MSAQQVKKYVPEQKKYERVILLIDMDCFYCQVEEQLNPQLKGQPVAVVQYNAWSGGGIIAVNYAARAKGVTRHMRGDEAKQQCADIQLVSVPAKGEKADLSKYRAAGNEVALVLQHFSNKLERASIDEAYVDITQTVNERVTALLTGDYSFQDAPLHNCYAVGYAEMTEYVNKIIAHLGDSEEQQQQEFACAHDDKSMINSDLRLLVGSIVASEIRAAVKAKTGYDCSAGIAHNKILAKLACGMNKPNKQTIIPLTQVGMLFDTLPVSKIKGLGGKFGEEVCERLQVQHLGELLKFSETELQRKFDEKNGSWLYNICRGIDLEAVTSRFYAKSIGCSKNFPGPTSITAMNTLMHWVQQLAADLFERLEKDMLEQNRKASKLNVAYAQEIDGEDVHSSRTVQLKFYDAQQIAQQFLDTLKTNIRPCNSSGSMKYPIKHLSISAGKFETIGKEQQSLQQMFANLTEKQKMQQKDVSTTAVAPVAVLNHKNANDNKDKPIVVNDFKTARNLSILANTDTTQQSNANVLGKYFTSEESKQNSFFYKALIHKTVLQQEDSNGIANEQSEQQTAKTLTTAAAQIDCRTNNTETNSPNVDLTTNSESNANTGNENCKICKVCNKVLPHNERLAQVHMDQHVAFKLSQEQRVEYQAELKRHKKVSPPTTSKKAKLNAGVEITKFLLPKTQKVDKAEHKPQQTAHQIAGNEVQSESKSDTTAMASNNTQVAHMAELKSCAKCGKTMPNDKFNEHMDYHLAKEIEKQWLSQESLLPETRSRIRSQSMANGRVSKTAAAGNQSILKFLK